MSSSNLSLYRFTNEILKLEQITSEEQLGELIYSPEVLLEMFKEKVDSCADYHRYICSGIDAIEKRQKEVKEILESWENKKLKLDNYFKENLKVLGVKELKGIDSAIKVQNNPPSIKITDETLIPLEFYNTTYSFSVVFEGDNNLQKLEELLIGFNYKLTKETKLDKKKVAEALRNGEIVEGAEQLQGQRIVVK